MALFNRKPKTDAVGMPPELQDYYQAENRDRTWMAWVLGFGTLVVTVLIALGLFYGGRWAYRKIRNQPANVSTTQTQNQPAQGSVNEQANNDSDQNSDNTGDSSADDADSPSSPATPPTTGTSSTSTTTPNSPAASAPDASGLPTTGPADTLAIFVGVTVVAYAVHRQFVRD